MRDVGQQRAERDDELRAERLGEVDDRARRTCASACSARCPGRGSGRAARAARGRRRPRPPASSISRVRPSVKLTFGRVAWKSKNSSGSIVAKRVAPSAAPTNDSAAEAASPASFQPLKAQTRAGARRPSGRLSHASGGIRVHGRSWVRAPLDRHACGPGQEVTGVFACTRKDRLTARTGAPYLARRAARPDRRVAGARVPRRRRPGRALRARRPRAGARARRALPRRAAGRAGGHRPGRAGRRPTRRRSCRSPTATSTSSTASSSTWPARCTTRATRRCSGGCSATTRCAPSGAARRARAAATTPTSAACSSTPSRSPSSPPRRASCTCGSTATCSSPRRSSTTSARRASSPTAPRSALSDEGRLLGHVELGLELLRERAAGVLDPSACSRCRTACSRTTARTGARPALRVGRGARAVPPQRARRERQGRARARPAVGRSSTPVCPPAGGADGADAHRALTSLLWSDEDGPQCALYEDVLQASRDAELVGGRVEVRTVHRVRGPRTGRFIRGEGLPELRRAPSVAPGAAPAWWPIRSSKPAGRRNPALGRFDSFAASSAGGVQQARDRVRRRRRGVGRRARRVAAHTPGALLLRTTMRGPGHADAQVEQPPSGTTPPSPTTERLMASTAGATPQPHAHRGALVASSSGHDARASARRSATGSSTGPRHPPGVSADDARELGRGVEDLTGREVVAFMSETTSSPDIGVELVSSRAGARQQLWGAASRRTQLAPTAPSWASRRRRAGRRRPRPGPRAGADAAARRPAARRGRRARRPARCASRGPRGALPRPTARRRVGPRAGQRRSRRSRVIAQRPASAANAFDLRAEPCGAQTLVARASPVGVPADASGPRADLPTTGSPARPLTVPDCGTADTPAACANALHATAASRSAARQRPGEFRQRAVLRRHPTSAALTRGTASSAHPT